MAIYWKKGVPVVPSGKKLVLLPDSRGLSIEQIHVTDDKVTCSWSLPLVPVPSVHNLPLILIPLTRHTGRSRR